MFLHLLQLCHDADLHIALLAFHLLDHLDYLILLLLYKCIISESRCSGPLINLSSLVVETRNVEVSLIDVLIITSSLMMLIFID